ncbi:MULTISPECIES: YCF48-related protein [Solimonas]|uniref:YCF48-related protein n=1 Tax=Solimonas TaxID=413435 RepID=UPI000370B662|nr:MULTISPECIES: YCF48-related protein [Solimonas]
MRFVFGLSAALLALGATASPPAPVPSEMAPRAAHSSLTGIAVAGEQLIAVGARGHILRSGDGDRWEQVAAPVDVLLTAVRFVDARNGWAVGHDATILHSDDGGRSWRLQHFEPGPNVPLLDVLFLDARHGFAVGAYGLMLETRDGGASWERRESALTEEGLHFNALARLGDGSLLLAGEAGMLARSADDGASWQRLQSPYESSLFGALPSGARGAVVAGLRGNVFRTDDVAAGTWTRVATDSQQSVFGLSALADGSVALAGFSGFLRVLGPDGRVAPPRPDGVSPEAARDSESSTFSGVVAWRDELITVGSSGVQRWRR